MHQTPVDPHAAFPGWHLAQINIARMRAPLDDPLMARFVAGLDAINRVAEESEGFVWRLKDDSGGASSYIKFDGDDRVIVNMSVWSSIGALHRYVYRSDHAAMYRDRLQWFEPLATPFALWWIPSGAIPAVDEGRRRLERLRLDGATPFAFTFKQAFAPEMSIIRTARLDLIPATAETLSAELSHGRQALEAVLGVKVPESWPPPLYDRDALEYALAWVRQHADQREWGFYHVVRQSSAVEPAVLVGAGGFKGSPNAKGEVEIGYSVLPEFQRQGFATEAVKGWLKFAFEQAGVLRVVAQTLPALTASRIVAERAGFRLAGAGHDPHAPRDEDVLRYEIDAPTAAS